MSGFATSVRSGGCSSGAWRVAAGAALALVLSGCRVGPDAEVPDLSAQFGPAFEGQADASAAAPADTWWERFGDPELAQLVRRAASESLDLRRLGAVVAEARAARGLARAAGRPTLDGTGGYEYQALGDDAFVPGGIPGGVETGTYRAGVVAGWELDLWGRVGRLTEAADAEIAVAQDDLDAARLSRAGEVARAVLDIRAADARRAVVLETLTLDDESVATAELRLHAGLADRIDLIRARRVRAVNRARLAPLDAERRDAELRLASLLGASRARPRVSVRPGAAMPAAPPVPALGLPADLLQRRPDLRSAAARYAAATARVGAVQAERYPTITLSGTFLMQGEALSDAFNPGARVLGIGPSLRVPLLDGGRLDAAVDQADARRRAALLALRAAAVRAVNEVDAAVAGLGFAEREGEQIRAAADDAQTAETLARSRYRAGTGEYLEVIEAAGQRLLIQEQQITARRQQLDRSVGLYLALGGGWAPAER